MPFSPFDLTGKVALVTGGNGGIGLGMAKGLAQAGAAVAIWGRNKDKNAAAEKTLSAFTRAKAYEVDVSVEGEIVEAMARTLADFSRLDCAIANAGIGGGAPFTQMTTEAWRRIMVVNLDGVFWTLREACKHMEARAKAGDPGGSLVAISSTSAIDGAPRNQAYATAKGGLNSMIRGIAVEYARYGIRANSILPGWVETDLAGPALNSQAFKEKVLPRQPVRRWGDPDEFAGIAVYLASSASSYHTGDEIVIDGGYTIF